MNNNQEIQLAQQFYELAERETRGVRAQFEYKKEHEEEFRNIPVRTLIEDPYFLGLKDYIFPSHLEDIEALWEERKKRTINLALFEESIGCVSGDTWIYLENGPKRIKNVLKLKEVGEVAKPLRTKIFTPSGLKETSHFKKTGLTKTKKIVTKYGYELEGTLDHPLEVYENGVIVSKQLKDFKIGDLVCIDLKEKPFCTDEEISEELAYELGYYFGKAENLKIEDFVFKMTKNSMAQYIGGLFDSIASINGQILIFRSRDQLRDIQQLLLMFGILSEIFPIEVGGWGLSIPKESEVKFKEKIKYQSTKLDKYFREINDNYPQSTRKWMPVIYIGESESVCYDFTVPSTGNFVANGFWSKNSGKSLIASVMIWLQWYEVATIADPQAYFGLTPGSTIAFMALSRSESQSRRVIFSEIFKRFKSGFNKDYFPPNPRFSKEISIQQNNTVVYGGTSSELCISPDEEVYTIDGLKKLKDLIGKKTLIYGYDIENQKTVLTEYQEIKYTGEKEVYEVEFEDGTKVKCTKDHKFLTYYYVNNRLVFEYKTLEEITKDDEILRVEPWELTE